MTNSHSSTPHWRETAARWTVLALRLAVGGTFVFSGLAKAIDIWGVGYKIDDYLAAFGWSWAMPFAGMMAVALPLFEFLAGLMLVIGSFRRATVIALLCCMAFMLPLSAYVMACNPVPDCGCFGEAWTLGNTATFWKNVALTAALAYLLLRNKRLRSLYGPAVQWLTLTMPAIVAMIVMAYGYYFQPMIDFRPYKVGTVLTNSGESFDDSNYVFIYEKNGVTKEFSINNLPDTSWTFVDRRETVVNHEADKKASPITAYDGDNSAADNLIPEKGVTLLLLIPDIEEINSLTNFRLNDINDLAADSGYQMICLTGSDEKQLDEWRELSMADYPVYRMDDSQLKQIARGNPAVVIVADGKIAYKSSFTDFYADFDNATKGKHLDIKTYTESMGEDYEYFLSLMLALAIGMAALLTINRAPLFFKLARLKKNKSKKAPDNRQPSPNASDSDLN